MRGDEAKEKCPDIVLARVPEVRGKADLTKYVINTSINMFQRSITFFYCRYRDAGKKVAEVLQTFTNLLERASVDEAYLDITDEVKKRLEQGLDQIKIEKLTNTFVVGCDTIDFIKSLKENTEFSESNIRLAIGGIITEEIRAEVLKKTGQCLLISVVLKGFLNLITIKLFFLINKSYWQ